jgi:hypothetical protein
MVTTTIDALDEQPDDLPGVTQDVWAWESREDLRTAVGAAVFSTPDLRERVWARIVARIENDQARESDEMAATAGWFDATAMYAASRAVDGRRPSSTSGARNTGIHAPMQRGMRAAVDFQGPPAIAPTKKEPRQ